MTNYIVINDIIRSIGATDNGTHLIIAEFKNGMSARYTTRILNNLMSDSFVKSIIDAETGELLYYVE